MPILPFTVPARALKAAGVFLAVVAVWFAVHEWAGAIRQSAVATTQLAEAKTAQTAERKVSVITAAHAVTEANAQDTIQEKTRVVIQRIPHYFERKVPVACVPWGLIRLHDAAVSGADPASAPVPAGQPDDACSPVAPSEFASVIASNYGVARQNAEQLDALEADIRQRIDAANGTGDNSDGSH